MELVTISQSDAPRAASKIVRLFDGTLSSVPEVRTRRFRRILRVRRPHASPIQVDGEAIDSPADVSVEVQPKALRVLVPTLEVDGLAPT
jgi:diacylglycerol kinase family enzyme